MKTIKLQTRIALSVGLVILLMILGLGTLLLYIGIVKGYTWILLLGSLISFVVLFFLIIHLKNTPAVKVDEYCITFNYWQSFRLLDLEEMSETTKKTIPTPDWLDGVINILALLAIFIGGASVTPSSNGRLPVTQLRFKNGKVKYFFDYYYKNSSEVKSYIKRAITNNQS